MIEKKILTNVQTFQTSKIEDKAEIEPIRPPSSPVGLGLTWNLPANVSESRHIYVMIVKTKCYTDKLRKKFT